MTRVIEGDCLLVMPTLEADSCDSAVGPAVVQVFHRCSHNGHPVWGWPRSGARRAALRRNLSYLARHNCTPIDEAHWAGARALLARGWASVETREDADYLAVTPHGHAALVGEAGVVGSGTTACAAVLEGFDVVGIEKEAEYANIARRRIAYHDLPLDRLVSGAPASLTAWVSEHREAVLSVFRSSTPRER